MPDARTELKQAGKHPAEREHIDGAAIRLAPLPPPRGRDGPARGPGDAAGPHRVARLGQDGPAVLDRLQL